MPASETGLRIAKPKVLFITAMILWSYSSRLHKAFSIMFAVLNDIRFIYVNTSLAVFNLHKISGLYQVQFVIFRDLVLTVQLWMNLNTLFHWSAHLESYLPILANHLHTLSKSYLFFDHYYYFCGRYAKKNQISKMVFDNADELHKISSLYPAAKYSDQLSC